MIATLLLAGALTATGAPQLDGIAIGQNITQIIKARLSYPAVSNTSVGHVWTWSLDDGTIEAVTTDDDGVVEMVDILASAENRRQIDVPGIGLLQFNESGHINAQFAADKNGMMADELLYLAKRPGTVVGYTIPPDYGSLAAFPGPGDQGLIEVLTGTRSALFKTGLVPEENSARAFADPALLPAKISRDVYIPAKISQWPANGRFVHPGQYVFIRSEVAADGISSQAILFAGAPGYDATMRYYANLVKFRPATLNGVPVPSVFFWRLSV